MFFVYILESTKNGAFYIGQTSELASRLKRHNDGRNKSTKSGRPWKILYWKNFESRSEAFKIEQCLKKLKKRSAIIKFVEKHDFRGVAQSGSEFDQIYNLDSNSRVLEK